MPITAMRTAFYILFIKISNFRNFVRTVVIASKSTIMPNNLGQPSSSISNKPATVQNQVMIPTRTVLELPIMADWNDDNKLSVRDNGVGPMLKTPATVPCSRTVKYKNNVNPILIAGSRQMTY